MNSNYLKIFIFSFLMSTIVFAQENIQLVTYGTDASITEGDDDKLQVIFIKIDSASTGKFYLEIFDPDCFADFDMAFNDWNTSTSFTLYGGSGAFSAPTLQNAFPNEIDIDSGTVIKTEIFSSNETTNSDWYRFAELNPSQGENIDGSVYFKFVVRGSSGNDANVYDLRITDDSGFIDGMPSGVELFSYNINLRLSEFDKAGLLQFNAPENNKKLTINYFDAGRAKVELITPFRDVSIPRSAGQGQWDSNIVELTSPELGNRLAVSFGQGDEVPNDAAFYIEAEGTALPLTLPIPQNIDNNRPEISFKLTHLSDCYSVVLDASNSKDPEGGLLNYTWDFGDGNSEKGSRVVHKYPDQTTYFARLIVSDNSSALGNSSYEDFEIKVNQPPVANAGTDFTSAPNQVFQLDGSASTDSDGEINKYIWIFDDGSTQIGKSISKSFNRSKQYTVTLRVEDNSGTPCNFGTDEIKIKINESPVADAGSDIITSPGENITLDASGSFDNDGSIVEYVWDLSNGETRTGKTISYNYKEPGNYNVKLTVKDNDGVANSTDEDFVNVKVNFAPVAEAGDNIIIADGEIVTFNALRSQDSDGIISNYTWNLGDGTSVQGANITHVYKSPGIYNVELKITDNSGVANSTSVDKITVTVNDKPIADAGDDIISTSGSIDFNGSFSKDNDGNLISYLWDFGDGYTSNEISPTHLYALPGIYEVTLTVQDNSGTSNAKDSDNLTVVINEKPLADAGPDLTVMPNQVINFDGSGSLDPDGEITLYEWDFGDGNILQGANVSHSFSKPGIYTVSLKVKDNTDHSSAVDFDESIITVNAAPVASAGKDIIAAPGEQVILDASSSFDEDGELSALVWEFSDGIIERDKPVITRTFDSPGVYTANLTVTDNSGAGNSVAVDKITISINHSPIARANEDIFTCDNLVEFSAEGSADADGDPLTFIWNFGDGTEEFYGLNPIHQYREPGRYPVQLTVDDGKNLSNSVTTTGLTVIINEPPDANAGEDRTICAGDVTLFNGGLSSDPEGGQLIYTWDFGDGTQGSGLNPTKSYTQGGVYTVTLKVQDDSGLPCNTDEDRMVVNVVESPVANAGKDMVVCANNEVKFDGSASTDFDGIVNSYDWDFGDGGFANGEKPVYIFTKSGEYKVRLTITGDKTEGCDNTATDELTVKVIDAPVADFTAPEIHPVNETILFDASNSLGQESNITNYMWNFGNGDIDSGKTVSYAFENYGKYKVSLKIYTDSETDCNSASINKTIVINNPPKAAAGEDIATGMNLPVIFNASNSKDEDGSIVNYSWDFGDGTTGSGVNIRHNFESPGIYNVILTVKDNTELSNNTDTDTILVTINESPEAVINMPEKSCINSLTEFSASGSGDKDGEIISYLWEFGDGTKAEGSKVEHSFIKGGYYNVKLIVTDNSGVSNNKGIISRTIFINNPPVAKTVGNVLVCPGDNFNLDGSLSSDPNGDSLTYTWEIAGAGTYYGVKPSISINNPGEYNAKLIVNDGHSTNCSASESQFSILVNSEPLAVIDAETEIFIGAANDEVLFDGTGSSDNDNDALTYIWDFGDGNTKSGANVFHSYIQAGEYIVTLTVDDGKNLSCSKSSTQHKIIVKERSSQSSN